MAVTEDAQRLRERLRLTNSEHERLASIAQGWWRLSALPSEHAARTLLYELGPERFCDRVLTAWARAPEGAGDPGWRALANLPRRWTAPKFPLKAADFIDRGVAKGPKLGAALAAAERAWIAAGFPNESVALGQIADDAAREC